MRGGAGAYISCKAASVTRLGRAAPRTGLEGALRMYEELESMHGESVEETPMFTADAFHTNE